MARLVRSPLPRADQLVYEILEDPKLVAAVRRLPGSALGRLIESVGLEDAAELVALATTTQLEAVFDEDLWRADPGEWEERLDAGRFGLWLHAFAEAGEEAVVHRLLELPFDLVTYAIHCLMLVIDIDSLAVATASPGRMDEFEEKALGAHQFEEWEEFRLISRNDSVWDELTQALLTLDRDHHALLRRILERCADLSCSWIDDHGGLYRVLSSERMLEGDLRAERDDRRGRAGYVSAADARAFLALARRGEGSTEGRDAITKAYFRELERTHVHPRRARERRANRASSKLAELIARSEMDQAAAPPPGKRARAASKERTPGRAIVVHGSDPGRAPRLLDRALAVLRQTRPERYDERMEELAYLANVLMAAPRARGPRLRPIEALEQALDVTTRGLEAALSAERRTVPDDPLDAAVSRLAATPADELFRRGYCAIGEPPGTVEPARGAFMAAATGSPRSRS